MPTYFISDLHLSAETPQLTEGFRNFVNGLQTSNDTLYILGDFFDAWVGDDEDQPYYLSIQDFLKEKTTAGLKTYFMAGNRDFLIGRRFAKYTGVELLKEPTSLNLGANNVVLMHGDSLCTSDRSYMIYRAIVRNAMVQRAVLFMPLDFRRKLAGGLRAKSQSMNTQKSAMIMDVVQTEVEQILERSNADILIHGHTHRPARHALGKRERIVLGDWGETGWCLKAEHDQLDLIEFNLSDAASIF